MTSRQQRRQHDRQQAKRNAGAIAETPVKVAVKWAFSPHSWRAAPTATEPATTTPPAIAINCNRPDVRQSDRLHDTPDAGADAGGETLKHCNGCKTNKPLEMFCVDRRSPDGLNFYCRPCANAKFAAGKAKRKALLEAAWGGAVKKPTLIGCTQCSESKPRRAFPSGTTRGSESPVCRGCTHKERLQVTRQKKAEEKALIQAIAADKAAQDAARVAARMAAEKAALTQAVQEAKQAEAEAIADAIAAAEAKKAAALAALAALAAEEKKAAQVLREAENEETREAFRRDKFSPKKHNKLDEPEREKICEACRKTHRRKHFRPDPNGLFGVSDICILCDAIFAFLKGDLPPDPYIKMREAGVTAYDPQDDDPDEETHKPRQRKHETARGKDTTGWPK